MQYRPGDFTVNWSGADDASGLAGAGIAQYDVYVSDNGSNFDLWLAGTPDASDTYTGEVGHTYAFFSVATDHLGHREPLHATADTQTNVVANVWHNYGIAYDADGDGNVVAQDVLLIIDYINAHSGDTSLPASPVSPPPYYDVDDDGHVTPVDVLNVIDYINTAPAAPTGEQIVSAEGESAGTRSSETMTGTTVVLVTRPWDPSYGQSTRAAAASTSRIEVDEALHRPAATLLVAIDSARVCQTKDTQAILARRWWPEDLDADFDATDVELGEILPAVVEDIHRAWSNR
jgi:hypothetical protein